VGPGPKLWFLVSLPDAAKAALAKVLGASHAIGALLLIVLALGHVAAAVFYHHFIKKDQVLRRMTPWTDIEAPAA
jgi:cytochrome b561